MRMFLLKLTITVMRGVFLFLAYMFLIQYTNNLWIVIPGAIVTVLLFEVLVEIKCAVEKEDSCLDTE